jgi:hypothetical protein
VSNEIPIANVEEGLGGWHFGFWGFDTGRFGSATVNCCRRSPTPAILGLLFLLPLVAGCPWVPAERHRAVQRQLLEAQERISTLEAQIADHQQTIRSQQEQIARARGLPIDTFEHLIMPVRIELERMSGGYALEGGPGHEGILLYIRPIDRDGHVVKAAGTIDVKLLELAAPADRMLIATYHFDLETTRSLWFGRMWTHHFSVRCPWPPDRLPGHNEITAQVVFTEVLTGAALTAHDTYEIVLPPDLPE